MRYSFLKAATCMVAAATAFAAMGATNAAHAATTISEAYVFANGSQIIGPSYASAKLNGTQYVVTFTNQVPKNFCGVSVTPSYGQFVIATGIVSNVNPLQVLVTLSDAAGQPVTSANFYVTVACL